MNWLTSPGTGRGGRVSSVGPIGIDWDGSRFVLAQRSAATDGAACGGLRRVWIERRGVSGDPDVDEFRRVRAVLARRGFEGTSVVLGVAPGVVTSVPMEVPPKLDDAAIGKLARMELARERRADPSELESAWWTIPAPARSGSDRHILAVGTSSASLERVIRAAIGAGLDVRAVDCGALALMRSVTGEGCPEGGGVGKGGREAITVAVDLRAEHAAIVVSLRDRVVYERCAPEIRTSGLIDAVCATLRVGASVSRRACESLSSIETEHERRSAAHGAGRVARCMREHVAAIVDEIDRAARYVRHRYALTDPSGTRVHVCGDPWLIGHASEGISGRLSIGAIPEPDAGVASGLALWKEAA